MTTQTLVARRPAMLSPAVDFLCVGGLSILISLAVLLSGYRLPVQYALGMYVVNFLINAPHFLVSYRLLYGAPQRRQDYQAVSLYVPLALLLYALFALAVYDSSPAVLGAMVGTGTILLAWHYTGQAYGMMASFGFIEGLRFDAVERRLLRANLYTLLGWHVSWAVVAQRKLFDPISGGSTLLSPDLASNLYRVATLLALASGLLGVVALVHLRRRTGRLPTAPMLAPWIAIHLWYVLLYKEPAAIFWAQNAHALQYLLFTMRVEMNRRERESSHASLPRHMLVYYLGTVILGLLVMQLVPELTQLAAARLGFGFLPLQLSVVAFINVHHYFIDNFIWKIRNPVVQRDLFSHLMPNR
ncbi:MAG: hypothetical protein OEO21_13525 [Candidatus Krumholzibacteria bacterium]|nr:hypothetical protein [Candidatus Krumholzibacteria bacterium]